MIIIVLYLSWKKWIFKNKFRYCYNFLIYDVFSFLNVFKLVKICNDLNMSIIVVYFILFVKLRYLIIKNVLVYILIVV